MLMTLDEMINETILILEESKTQSTLNVIKSAINYVYEKIMREKFNLPVTSLLTKTTDKPAFPETSNIDCKMLTFYAAYFFLKVNGDDEGKATNWLLLFNDAFDNVFNSFGSEVVVDVIFDGGEEA